jgi:hypothetical protein
MRLPDNDSFCAGTRAENVFHHHDDLLAHMDRSSSLVLRLDTFARHCRTTFTLMMTRGITIISVSLFVALSSPFFASDEHPGPPQQPQLKKSPQTTTSNPQGTAQPLVVSDAEVSAGVKKYIYTQTQKSADKKFHVQSGGKDVALDLITIHDDRLSDLGGNKHFVCVDMKAANGAIYDIDFFIIVRSGKLSVTEASVHKINGKPLYNWNEDKGVWKKVSVS